VSCKKLSEIKKKKGNTGKGDTAMGLSVPGQGRLWKERGRRGDKGPRERTSGEGKLQ